MVTIPTASTARAALDLFEGFCLDGAQREETLNE
jgi:hypothetical protein